MSPESSQVPLCSSLTFLLSGGMKSITNSSCHQETRKSWRNFYYVKFTFFTTSVLLQEIFGTGYLLKLKIDLSGLKIYLKLKLDFAFFEGNHAKFEQTDSKNQNKMTFSTSINYKDRYCRDPIQIFI